MINLEKSGKKTIAVLLLAQGQYSASSILVFTFAAIVTVELAGGNKQWTGVPSVVIMIAAALVAYPIGRLMDRSGRRVGLLLGQAFGFLGGLLGGWAVIVRSMPALLGGLVLLGLARGVVELSRYAAAEANPTQMRGRAINLVVLGGTFGAVFGPPLTTLSANLANQAGIPIFSGPCATFFTPKTARRRS